MLDYFKPKSFETINGKSVYRYLGINFFKKRLLLTDLILFRARGKRQFDLNTNGKRREFERLEWQTRRDESIHIVFMCIIAAIAGVKNDVLSLGQWIGIFLINLYANVYPIFLQRHNRIRLLKLLTLPECAKQGDC